MNPFQRAWRWLQGGPPPRKPRRPKCTCGHVWALHAKLGCSGGDYEHKGEVCPCNLGRRGQPARRALARAAAVSGGTIRAIAHPFRAAPFYPDVCDARVDEGHGHSTQCARKRAEHAS